MLHNYKDGKLHLNKELAVNATLDFWRWIMETEEKVLIQTLADNGAIDAIKRWRSICDKVLNNTPHSDQADICPKCGAGILVYKACANKKCNEEYKGDLKYFEVCGENVKSQAECNKCFEKGFVECPRHMQL